MGQFAHIAPRSCSGRKTPRAEVKAQPDEQMPDGETHYSCPPDGYHDHPEFSDDLKDKEKDGG
jgi:hypothetical protein